MNPLLSKLLAPRQMEYVIVDQDLKITEISWGVQRFADLPEALTMGKDVRISFPELIGLEEQLMDIFNGIQPNYELKTVYRHPQKHLYFDIYIVADQDYRSQKTTLIIVFEDVTEKMIIEQELVQRTNEASLLLHNLMVAKSYTEKIIYAMADALIVTDNTGKIKTVNPAAQNLLGYSEDELLNQPLSLILSSEQLFLPMCQIPQLYDSLFRDMEIIFQHKNGEEICVSFSCSFVDNEMEEQGDFVYIGRNITERKQVEKKHDELLLEEQKARKKSEISQQKFRFLVESIPQQVWMAKPDGSYNYVNYHLRVYLGCRHNEILDEGWKKHIHPDDLPWVLTQWEKCLQTGEKYETELRIKQGDSGIYRWHLSRALPMRDRLGNIVNWFGTNTDIEEHKIAVQELKNSETSIRALYKITSARNTNFEQRLQGLLALGRRRFQIEMGALLRLEGDDFEIIGEQKPHHSNFKINKGDKIHAKNSFCYEAFKIKDPVYFECAKTSFWQEHPAYNILHLESYIGVVIMVKNQKYGVLSFFSHTPREKKFTLGEKNFLKLMAQWVGAEIERQIDQKELINSLEKQKELNELKTQFITMASHEFRTPLSTILASSDLLKNYYHKLPEEKRIHRLDKIINEVKNMTQLLEDVLIVGKTQSGYLRFNPLPIDLCNVCGDILEEIKVNAKANVIFQFNCSVKETIYLDEKLLRHIISNLLSNAVKYSPIGSIINLDVSYENQQAIIQVEDRGIGIPESDQNRLFEIFQRGSNVGNVSGTGLGLAIIKNAIDLHEGSINFTSKLGQGTIFTVCLPNQQLNNQKNQN